MKITLIIFMFLINSIISSNANNEGKYNLQNKVHKINDSSLFNLNLPKAVENSVRDKLSLSCRKCCLGEFKEESEKNACDKNFHNWNKKDDCGCQ